MLKAASDVGYSKICLTPHYMEDGYRTSHEELEQKVEILQECACKENINLEILLGEEVLIFPTMAQHLNQILPINDSRYVLMELPLWEEVAYVNEVIYELLSHEKVPIIAHPERYMLTQKNPEWIEELVQKGALLQVNMNSILGLYGRVAKKNAIRLLKNHMASFLSSDSHSSMGYYKIKESMKMLKTFVDTTYFYELTEDNPEKVLQDDEIEISPWISNKRRSFLMRLK